MTAAASITPARRRSPAAPFREIAQSGGGLYNHGAATITNSTLSGNIAGDGGGILNGGTATITSSTISGNTAGLGDGGGLYNASGMATLNNTIVANSVNGGDIVNAGGTCGAYNLVEDGQNLGSLMNTLTGDPLLGPAGRQRRADADPGPLPGSLAIDAGDPNFNPNDYTPPLVNDQRRLARVANGGVNGLRIDIGAYEAQAPPPALLGDYNLNDTVDAADYVLWRKMQGQTGLTPFSGADGNGDGDITTGDYVVWRDNFGNSAPGLR